MIISLIASFHIFFLQSNSPPSSPRGNSRNSQVNGSTRPNSQEQLSDVSTSSAAFVNDAIMIIKHLLILCLIHTLDGFLYVSECVCIYIQYVTIGLYITITQEIHLGLNYSFGM